MNRRDLLLTTARTAILAAFGTITGARAQTPIGSQTVLPIPQAPASGKSPSAASGTAADGGGSNSNRLAFNWSNWADQMFINCLKWAEYWDDDYSPRYFRGTLNRDGYARNMDGWARNQWLQTYFPISNRTERPGRYIVRGKGRGTVGVGQYIGGSRYGAFTNFNVPDGANVTATANGTWYFYYNPPQNATSCALRYRTEPEPNNIGDLEFIYEEFLAEYEQGYMLDPKWREILRQTKGTWRMTYQLVREHGGPAYPSHPDDDMPLSHFTWRDWSPIDRYGGHAIPQEDSTHFQVDEPAGGWKNEPAEGVWCFFPRGRAIAYLIYDAISGEQHVIKIRSIRPGDVVSGYTMNQNHVFPIDEAVIAEGRHLVMDGYGSGWQIAPTLVPGDPADGGVGPRDGIKILHSERNSDGPDCWTLTLRMNTTTYASIPWGSSDTGGLIFPQHYLRIGPYGEYRPIRSHCGVPAIPYIIHRAAWVYGKDYTGYSTYIRRDATWNLWLAITHLCAGPSPSIFIRLCNEANVSPAWWINWAAIYNAPQFEDRVATKDEISPYVRDIAEKCRDNLNAGLVPVFESFPIYGPTWMGWIYRRYIRAARGWNTGEVGMGMSLMGQVVADVYGITDPAQVKNNPHYRIVYPLEFRDSVGTPANISNSDNYGRNIGTSPSPWTDRGGDPAYKWCTHYTVNAEVYSPYYLAQINQWAKNPAAPNNFIASQFALLLQNFTGNPQLVAHYVNSFDVPEWDANTQYYGPRDDGRLDFVIDWTKWAINQIGDPGPPHYYALRDSLGSLPAEHPEDWQLIWRNQWNVADAVNRYGSGSLATTRLTLQRVQSYFDYYDTGLTLFGTEGGVSYIEGVGNYRPLYEATTSTQEMGVLQQKFFLMWDEFGAKNPPISAIAGAVYGGGASEDRVTSVFVNDIFGGISGSNPPRWQAILEYNGYDVGPPQAPPPPPPKETRHLVVSPKQASPRTPVKVPQSVPSWCHGLNHPNLSACGPVHGGE